MRSLSLVCIAGSLLAADPTNIDIRLTAGIAPGISEFSVTGTNSTTVEMNADIGYFATLQGAHTWRLSEYVGLVAAGGVFGTNHRGTDKTSPLQEMSLTAYGAEITPALVVRINETIWCEVGPAAGYGYGQLELSGPGGSNFERGEGDYLTYGARIASYVEVRRHFIIGVEVGYRAYQSNVSLPLVSTPVDVDVEVRGDGVQSGITIGYRF